MTEATRKTLEEKLNQAVDLFKHVSKEKNEAEWQKQLDNVWLCFYHWCTDWESVQNPLYADYTGEKSIELLNVFYDTLEKFDLSYGKPYSHYFNRTWNRRKKDSKDDIEFRARTIRIDEPPKEQEDKGKHKAPVIIMDKTAIDSAHDMMVQDRYIDLTTLILHLRERIGVRAANPARERWFRMFYTEDITRTVKTIDIKFTHEHDVMQAIYQSYLDYYMTRKCSSTAQIRKTPLEPLCKFTENPADTQEISCERFPVCVSLTYLERCENTKYGNSARSNQRKNYEDMIKKEIT